MEAKGRATWNGRESSTDTPEKKNNSTQMVTYYIATCLKAKQTSIFFVWFAQRHRESFTDTSLSR